MDIILSFAIILLSGVLAAKLLHKVKFPAVTAYLLLGILFGPEALNLISGKIIDISGLISNIVLSIIAFGLGQNFSRENFRRTGKSVLWISILEASSAWIAVTLALFLLLKKPLYLSLLFGAIASATAPAATVMVIREFKAKGTFTSTLLGIVAIDDAWCLIIFAISLVVAKSLATASRENLFLLKMFLYPIINIGVAFLLGASLAWIISFFSRYIKTRENLLIYTLGFIFLNASIAMHLHLSILLTNMFMGMFLANINKESFRFFDILKTVDPPLYLCFFILSGANLELTLLGEIGVMGSTYFLFRLIGKLTGASLGAYISKAAVAVRKYIGFGLVPQAGVALGVALIAKVEFPSFGGIIFTTVTATTIVYEVIGPFCTKFALIKAGEVRE